jgi:hypothetical protein
MLIVVIIACFIRGKLTEKAFLIFKFYLQILISCGLLQLFLKHVAGESFSNKMFIKHLISPNLLIHALHIFDSYS